MIINPSVPSGHVTFCDDIRDEVNGKHSIIGTYGSEMIVYGEAPVRIPTLAILISYRDDPDTLPKKITLRITREGTETEVMLEAEIAMPELPPELNFALTEDDPDSKAFAELRTVARYAGMELTENCKIKVRVHIGDDEVRLGTLRVRLAPLPSTQSQEPGNEAKSTLPA